MAPKRVKHYRLGLGPSDDETSDQNVVTGPKRARE